MAGTLTQVPITPGSGKNIEVVQDSGGNQHPVGILEFVDAALNPIPVSAANPLPATIIGSLPGGPNTIGAVVVGNFPTFQAVSGTFWQATQPVSAASLPLPAGAATAAKQPAPGTAGTPSADVLTVQGAASMAALKVDGSGVTQPVSGSVTVLNPTATVTANAGTNLNTSLLALESGGNLAAINAKLGTLGQKAMAGSAPVTLASDQPAIPVAVADAVATGNITAVGVGPTLTGLNGRASILLQLGGTFVGSVVVEYSNDSFATVKTASALTPTGVSNAAQTAPGFYRYTGISGYAQARARCSAFTSGTIVATLVAGAGADAETVISVIPQNFQATDNAVANAAAPARAEGSTNPLSTDLAGNLRTALASLPALVAGTAVVGKVGIDQTTPGATNAVQAVAGASGGAVPYPTVVSSASNNATAVKASPGTLFAVAAVNASTTSAAYVKFYDKATAPAPASDAPVGPPICLPAASSASQPTVVVLTGPAVGRAFALGIGFAIVANPANNDNTAIAAGQVLLGFDYK